MDPSQFTRIAGGQPHPLGAVSDGLGVNFAVFSANATRIELCLFDPKGRKELRRFDLPECTDEATCRTRIPDWCTAIAPTARTIRAMGTVSIPISCCSIPTRGS
jgi:pullulanase/glycogen debranching enzyme